MALCQREKEKFMIIPYRTQRLLGRILAAVLTLAVIVAVGCACWFVWAQRYIIYTADGQARLDFNLPPITPGVPATEPEKTDVTIRFDTEETVVGTSTELAQLAGYYVEPEALKNLAEVKQQIAALPAGAAVMVDVKSIQGAFYYSSTVSTARSSRVNAEQMDELIDYLSKRDVYAIARLPALRDYTYGLNHVPDGVHHSSGGYLYQDGEGCYWLHPASQGTISYLTQIIVELRNLGFDEVVLDDFCFPQNTTAIRVNGDRAQLLTNAANVLLKACATERFAVSFVKTEEFTPPTGRSRIYMTGLDASQAQEAAQNAGVADVAINLVFLTELHNTRFNLYSVRRPLSGAH